MQKKINIKRNLLKYISHPMTGKSSDELQNQHFPKVCNADGLHLRGGVHLDDFFKEQLAFINLCKMQM